MRAFNFCCLLGVVACNAASPPSAGAPVPASAPAPGPSRVEAVAAAPMNAAAEDWLVWSSRGGNWTTRWIRSDATQVVAERPALVVGDGARMWRVERHNGVVEVLDCACAGMDIGGSKCGPPTRVTSLGLRSVELGTDATTELIKPLTGTEYAANPEARQDLEVVGGAGSKVLVLVSEESYTCNEVDIDRGVLAFDIATGLKLEDYRDGLMRQLPPALVRDASLQIKKELIECEDEGRLGEEPSVEELGVLLVAGAPKLRWTLGVIASHTCTHVARGQVSSGLIPAAASLGLDAVPAGVAQALAALGDAEAVGWSRIEFAGPAREEALARFTAVEASVWPIERSVRVGGEPTEESRLDAGRRLTREKNYAAAIAAFDAALVADETLATAYSGRGHARQLAGDLDAAKLDFQAALTHDSKPAFQASVYFNLGQVAEKQGDVAAARSAYTRSIELRPNETVSAALAKLPR